VETGISKWRTEQLTFGPTEQEGIAVASDGHFLLTSVGLKIRTVWVHDHSGDHQVAFNGSAVLMGGLSSSRAIFSADGTKLFFFGSRNSDEKRELWQADLGSGQVERILPGFSPAHSFGISPDDRQLVFDSYDANDTLHLWLAWLDRYSPPEYCIRSWAEGSPVFGPGGDIYYEGQTDEKVYLYRRSPSGSDIVRVTPHSIVRLETISPDGKWLVAEAAIEGETKRGVQAFKVADGSIKRICYVLCLARWATQGRFMFVAFPGNTMAASSYKTFIIPLHHGSVCPDLRRGGIKSEQDLMGLNGVKIVNDLLHPGSDNVSYAFDRASRPSEHLPYSHSLRSELCRTYSPMWLADGGDLHADSALADDRQCGHQLLSARTWPTSLYSETSSIGCSVTERSAGNLSQLCCG